MSRGPRVKICGLQRNEDALFAQEAGADYLGVVLTAGFGRSVPWEAAPSVVAQTSVARVAVLVDESPAAAAEAAAVIDASVLQLHGDEGVGTIRELRERGPWLLWKAVRARSLDDLHRAVDALGDDVDGFLVEGWRDGVVGGGGVRVTLEPAAVRAVVPSGVDLILAGGLEPGSVAEMVARFWPEVVDVSSGVESEVGRKDHGLVQAFIREAGGVPSPDP